jgi:hypothetical protein
MREGEVQQSRLQSKGLRQAAPDAIGPRLTRNTYSGLPHQRRIADFQAQTMDLQSRA